MALSLFVIPSVASAAVTTTTITSPADGEIVVWDSRTDTGTSSIAGTAPGASNTDVVDILCYEPGDADPDLVADDVPVTGGQFSHSDLSWASGSLCRMRAVPDDTVPLDTSPFPGPLVEINEIRLQLENPDDDQNLKPNRWGVYTGQFGGRMEWSAAGSCPFESSLVDLTAFTETEAVFYCSHRFNGLNDLEQDVDPPESPIQIDGDDGWTTANLIGAAFENDPGFPALTFSPSIDLVNGNVEVEASEGIVTCTGDEPDWWAPDQSCPPLLDTGVRLDRTITQSHAGTKAVVRDRWVSTDGQPHTISLDYREDFEFTNDGSSDARFLFPGPTTYDGPTEATVVPGPIAEGSMIYAFDPSFADGSTEVGRAGIKLVSGADSAAFESDDPEAPRLVLGYANRTIPAGGALEITTEFYQAFTRARIDELAAGAPDVPGDSGNGGGGGTGGGGTPPPTDTAPAQPTITGAIGAKSTASRAKRPRVTISTTRSVNCPATGNACSATVALTTKVTVRSKGKTKTKTVKLGNYSFNIPAGQSRKLSFKLPSSATKYFRGKGSLKLSGLITAGATGGSPVVADDVYKVKPPKFKK